MRSRRQNNTRSSGRRSETLYHSVWTAAQLPGIATVAVLAVFDPPKLSGSFEMITLKRWDDKLDAECKQDLAELSDALEEMPMNAGSAWLRDLAGRPWRRLRFTEQIRQPLREAPEGDLEFIFESTDQELPDLCSLTVWQLLCLLNSGWTSIPVPWASDVVEDRQTAAAVPADRIEEAPFDLQQNSSDVVVAFLKTNPSEARPIARCCARGWKFVQGPVRGVVSLAGFSARLWPTGRQLREDDWKFIKEVIRGMNIPMRGECVIFSDLGSIREDPGTILVWVWAPMTSKLSDDKEREELVAQLVK